MVKKLVFLHSSSFFISLNNKPQQAGGFIDEESPDYISAFFSGLAAEKAVFKAAEKPLIYEIGGIGLAKGMPFYNVLQ